MHKHKKIRKQTRGQTPSRFVIAGLFFLSACAFDETRTPPLQPTPKTAPVATAAATITPQKAEAVEPGSDESSIDDGPYASYQTGKDGLVVSWVCKGKVISKTFDKAAGAVIAPECGYAKSVTVRDQPPTFPVPAKFTAKKLVALSDVHGQFDTMIKLLQANGVIDRELKWTFGDGHMVMIGDILDRGPKVTEVLWFLYQLEAQARAAGGAVHTMLGNHEAIVLYDDLRYINPKYATVAKKLDSTYPALFGEQTVLGRWLRAKPMLLQVNDMLFVHGGLNPDYAALKLSVTQTNEAFRTTLGQPRATIRATPLSAFLYGSSGPIWYRGYFRDPQISSEALDALLAQYGVKRIVVGHTTLTGAFSHYGGRVLNTDTGILRGVSGELLFWDEGKVTRGTMQGERLPLSEYAKGKDAG